MSFGVGAERRSAQQLIDCLRNDPSNSEADSKSAPIGAARSGFRAVGVDFSGIDQKLFDRNANERAALDAPARGFGRQSGR
jgi:hypothetical protein